jgi:tRNA A37 threonylcarbamoyladenosine synthetase subunit TsaC/SUA5/YrdC
VLSHCSIAFAVPGVTPSPGLASTVVDLRSPSTGDAPVVLREGTVSAAEVLQRIGALG